LSALFGERQGMYCVPALSLFESRSWLCIRANANRRQFELLSMFFRDNRMN
jgi:hypothetical protein